LGQIQKKKGGIKLHTVLDLESNIPTIIIVTNAKIHDVNLLDEIEFENGAFYIMDRGYIDYVRLYKINKSTAFFVIRAKTNLAFKVLKSSKVDKDIGLRCDQIVCFSSKESKEKYPASLRRVKFYDKQTNKTYVYLTNNLNISAISVTLLYKKRWRIELFFKWIKQHLIIKRFWGRNENAVKMQIWVAVSNYALVYLIKNELNLTYSTYEILEILSDSLFEQIPLNQLLMKVE